MSFNGETRIQEYVSYMMVGVIWTTVVIILLTLLLFPDQIYYWVKVCDKCTVATAQYIYVIRFIFGSIKKPFDSSKTTIIVEIIDEKKVMVRFRIQPKQLVEYIPDCPNPPLKTVRFLLYRKEELKNIKNVTVNHNGTGYISVTTIEIQDLNEKEANIAYIGAPIYSLSKEKAFITQFFPSAQRELRSLEEGLKPSVSLNAKEFVIFICLALNIMLIHTAYVIPCNQNVLCDDYREGFLSSVYSGLLAGSVAALVTAMLCTFHRYVVKTFLYKGIKVFYWFRLAIIFSVIAVSLVLGVFTVVMASQKRKFSNEILEELGLDDQVFWMIAFSIANVILFLFWMPIFSSIGYWIGFFSEPEEVKVEFKPEITTYSKRSDETEETNYMTALMKSNTKVKSISQYGGLNQNISESKRSTKEDPSNHKVKRSESNESTGSGYYKQLIRSHGKVKSVSQY